jgi:hypothetical protein
MAEHVRRYTCLAAGLLICLITIGCAPAKVSSTWRDPSLTGPIRFKKIVVLAIHPDAVTRRIVEDEMVKQIGSDRTVPGYTVLSDAERDNVTTVKAKVQQLGFDGAVTIKPAGARSASANAGPGSSHSFIEDYDKSVSSPEHSGGTTSQNVLVVQTNIYSVAEGKLLWQATVDLYDPKDARQIVADVVKVVGAELRKEKLIQ